MNIGHFVAGAAIAALVGCGTGEQVARPTPQADSHRVALPTSETSSQQIVPPTREIQ